MKIRVTDRDGTSHAVEGQAGLKLMEVLRELDYGVEALCGGMCSCATCHVYVDTDWIDGLAPPEDDEDDLLDSLEGRHTNSRLSCQILLGEEHDGLTVTIAPEE